MWVRCSLSDRDNFGMGRRKKCSLETLQKGLVKHGHNGVSEFTSEKHLPPINLKLTIPTYFVVVIMNMMMKIPALIFKVKTKRNCF